MKSDDVYIKIKSNVNKEINDSVVLAFTHQEVLEVLKTNLTRPTKPANSLQSLPFSRKPYLTVSCKVR